eukprot:GGOE01061492.1.p1 GENE.GGOE01061492.1~~GGOE01061492.1.p1  ORF type:complete len:504 (-),score=107.28 GGOE01061492.1:235-1746(-)
MALLLLAQGVLSLLWSVALFIDEHFAVMCLGTLMVGCLGYNVRTATRPHQGKAFNKPHPLKPPHATQRPPPLQPLHAHISPRAPEILTARSVPAPREVATRSAKSLEDSKSHRFPRLRLSKGEGEGHWSLLRGQHKVKTPDSTEDKGRPTSPLLCTLQHRLHSWTHGKPVKNSSPSQKHPQPLRSILATDPTVVPAVRPSLHPPPTPAERKLIGAFRSAIAADARYSSLRGHSRLVQAAETSDRACMRFLLARNCDVKAAVSMFSSTMVWRDENGLDTLLDRPAPKMAAVAQLINEGFPHKCDMKGRPVMIDQVARLDADAVLSKYSVEECIAYTTHWMEFRQRFILDTHEADGPLIDEAVTILDMAGLSRQHVTLKMFGFLQAMAKVGQDYYPETMGKVVIINGGWLFSLAWRTVRQFLDAGTQQKVVVCGDRGLDELRSVVARDSLPPELGGACQCPGGCNGRAAWDIYFQVCERGAAELAEDLGGYPALKHEVQRAFGLR